MSYIIESFRSYPSFVHDNMVQVHQGLRDLQQEFLLHYHNTHILPSLFAMCGHCNDYTESLGSRICIPKPNNTLYTQIHLLDYNICHMTVAGFDAWLSLILCLQLLMNDIYNHLYKITSHNLLFRTLQFQLKWQHIQPHLIVLPMYCTPPLDSFNLYRISTFLRLWDSSTIIAQPPPLNLTIPYKSWFDNLQCTWPIAFSCCLNW